MNDATRRQLIAFLVKFGATFASIYVIALFFPLWGHMHIGHAFFWGLVIAAVGYLFDLFLPRATNYIVATAVDFVTAALILGWGDVFFPGMEISWPFAWFAAALIAGAEIFYHLQFVRKSNEPVGKPGPDR